MKIGIDIDGVLTDCGKFTIEQGLKYCKENKKGKLVNPDAYDSDEIFDWDKETDNESYSQRVA